MAKYLIGTSSKTVPKLRFLSAWFCPYAHRATIALEHHAGRIEYEWVEVRGPLALFAPSHTENLPLIVTDSSIFAANIMFDLTYLLLTSIRNRRWLVVHVVHNNNDIARTETQNL
jgi:hypothetical protein